MVSSAVTRGMPDGKVQPLYLTFENNSLLPALFGEHDRHLAQIEKILDVWVTSRGNRLALSGSPESTSTARKVLVSLAAVPDLRALLTSIDSFACSQSLMCRR